MKNKYLCLIDKCFKKYEKFRDVVDDLIENDKNLRDSFKVKLDKAIRKENIYDEKERNQNK